VLFEAATRVPPSGETGVQGLNGSRGSSVSPSVRSHRRVPADLARAIERCLHEDAGSRPQAMELSRLLDRFVESRLGSKPVGGA
jgi:hypothetical protein